LYWNILRGGEGEIKLEKKGHVIIEKGSRSLGKTDFFDCLRSFLYRRTLYRMGKRRGLSVLKKPIVLKRAFFVFKKNKKGTADGRKLLRH